MIMTEFITRNYGNKEFEVIIKTDSEEHYKETQDFARKLIDHAKQQTNADRVRAMNAEQLAEWALFRAPQIGREYSHSLIGLITWLQQPAKETKK